MVGWLAGFASLRRVAIIISLLTVVAAGITQEVRITRLKGKLADAKAAGAEARIALAQSEASRRVLIASVEHMNSLLLARAKGVEGQVNRANEAALSVVRGPLYPPRAVTAQELNEWLETLP